MLTAIVNKSATRQSIWMIGYFLLAIGLALATPDTIMNYSWARSYTEFIATWNPFVEHIGLWSKIPATQWLAAVLNALAACWMFPLFFKVNETAERMKALNWLGRLKMIGGAAIALVMIWFVMFSGIIGPSDRHIRSMISSPIGMGTTGGLFIMGQWMITIALISHLLALGKILFASNKKKE